MKNKEPGIKDRVTIWFHKNVFKPGQTTKEVLKLSELTGYDAYAIANAQMGICHSPNVLAAIAGGTRKPPRISGKTLRRMRIKAKRMERDTK